ncbi:MAG: DUF4007 family protein [Prochlorothrix sp.]|nr:DUF4007 family protein [Prochlorothrix sp.]
MAKRHATPVFFMDSPLVPSPPPSPTSTVVFARHETFHPRFGWLKKGFDAASADPDLFLREDAPLQLGVGKNMVKSIRYWCTAFKILADDRPTSPLLTNLLKDEGWDPYLEDPASLWLLHWFLLKPPCTATTWAFSFYQLTSTEFTAESLLHDLQGYRDSIAPRIADSSLRKDISCFLRMYAKQPVNRKGKGGAEEALDCPFAELGLIQNVGLGALESGSRRYRFVVGPKLSLPPEIIVYTALDYASAQGNQMGSVPLMKVLFDPYSPGLALKLTENSLIDAITQVNRLIPTIRLEDLAGRMTLAYDSPPRTLAQQVLGQYYTP